MGRLKTAEKERRLSTIEMTVLGIAWREGPCTTYAIMRDLSTSPSSYHKSRAGTAYSATKRLIEHGLLEYTGDQTERENLVQITPAGMERLREWVSPPIFEPDFSHTADLVRLRFYFLGIVDKETQLRFIEESERGIQDFLAVCEAAVKEFEPANDQIGALAALSIIIECQGRLKWLRIAREIINKPVTPKANWTKEILKRLKND